MAIKDINRLWNVLYSQVGWMYVFNETIYKYNLGPQPGFERYSMIRNSTRLIFCINLGSSTKVHELHTFLSLFLYQIWTNPKDILDKIIIIILLLLTCTMSTVHLTSFSSPLVVLCRSYHLNHTSFIPEYLWPILHLSSSVIASHNLTFPYPVFFAGSLTS